VLQFLKKPEAGTAVITAFNLKIRVARMAMPAEAGFRQILTNNKRDFIYPPGGESSATSVKDGVTRFV
jgi:hypothetical protein